MTGKTEKQKEIVAAAREAIPGVTFDEAKLYGRLRLGKKTLAYIWPAGKDATRIDLYVEQASLPKSITAFSPGRGRARKEGLIATLSESSGKRETKQVVEGLKVAAEFAAPAPEEPKEAKKEDELSTDLQEAAAGADAAAREAAEKREAKPDPKKKDKVAAA